MNSTDTAAKRIAAWLSTLLLLATAPATGQEAQQPQAQADDAMDQPGEYRFGTLMHDGLERS